MSPLRHASALLALLAAPALAQPGGLAPQPCALPGTGAAWADSAGVACYTLAVPENRADPASRTLRLAVAVAEATGPGPAEPLLYLHGGPGIATLDNVPRYLGSPAWRRLRERHALVFMDYRGAGRSEPAWCPDLEEAVRAIDRESPSDGVRIDRMAAAFGACRAAMEAEGLDLAGYASADLAADAEALRAALGLPAWNVYGVSFGTHVALNLVRAHPEGVRALVLDSAFPPNAPYLDWLRPFAEGLDVVSRACAADRACARRVPAAAAAFRAAVARLEAAPLDVPVDSTGRTDRVDGTDFAWSVWTALLNPRHIPLVPLAVEAGAARDSVALTAWARRFIDPDAFGSSASAQFFAVWCTEGRPRTPEQTETAALAAHPELAGFLVLGLEAAVCDAWQPHRAPASAAEAVVSDVPTLVLTGAFDPVTRPADGHLAATTLSRAQVLDVPAASHAALHADACTIGLAAAFLEAPTEPLDAACLAERPPLRFVTAGTLADALAPPARMAITNVTVVDVEAGARLAGHTVVVEGERIAAVGPSADVAVPDGATVVDAAGRFLIPGLWDMHVHAARDGRARRFWPLFVAHGVTGIRETGSYLDSLLHWRAVARATPDAPRIVWSSPMLDGDPPSYAHGRSVRTSEEARAVVAEMQAHGFDYLKVYDGLSRDVFFALADEARRRGVVIAGEVPSAVAPLDAATAGMRTFEHLWNLFESCVPGAYALRDSLAVLGRRDAPEAERYAVRQVQYRRWLDGYDPACADDLAAGLQRAGTWQVPTLVINRSYSFMDSTWTDDRRRRWVPRRTLDEWDALREEVLAEYGPLGIQAWRARYRNEADLLRRMVAAGVGVLAGSDASDEPFVYPGASLHDELALLVEAGLTPLEALRAATLNPARALGREVDLGTVAPGKLADFVLLDADPLADITNTTRIHAVVLNGRLLDRAALDRLLDQAEAAAQSD